MTRFHVHSYFRIDRQFRRLGSFKEQFIDILRSKDPELQLEALDAIREQIIRTMEVHPCA